MDLWTCFKVMCNCGEIVNVSELDKKFPCENCKSLVRVCYQKDGTYRPFVKPSMKLKQGMKLMRSKIVEFVY